MEAGHFVTDLSRRGRFFRHFFFSPVIAYAGIITMMLTDMVLNVGTRPSPRTCALNNLESMISIINIGESLWNDIDWGGDTSIRLNQKRKFRYTRHGCIVFFFIIIFSSLSRRWSICKLYCFFFPLFNRIRPSSLRSFTSYW